VARLKYLDNKLKNRLIRGRTGCCSNNINNTKSS
jgi:hypothetical protein